MDIEITQNIVLGIIAFVIVVMFVTSRIWDKFSDKIDIVGRYPGGAGGLESEIDIPSDHITRIETPKESKQRSPEELKEYTKLLKSILEEKAL